VCSLLLFVRRPLGGGGRQHLRRPWKKYQAEFSASRSKRLEDSIAAEQAKLDADRPTRRPRRRSTTRRRASPRARAPSSSRPCAPRSIRRSARTSRKDLNLRFVKSELEELRYSTTTPSTTAGRRTRSRRRSISAWRPDRAAEDLRRLAGEDCGPRGRDQGDRGRRQAGRGDARSHDGARRSPGTPRDAGRCYLPGPKASPPFVGWGWQPKIPKDPADRAPRIRSQQLRPGDRARGPLHLVPCRHRTRSGRGSAQSWRPIHGATSISGKHPREVRLHVVPLRCRARR